MKYTTKLTALLGFALSSSLLAEDTTSTTFTPYNGSDAVYKLVALDDTETTNGYVITLYSYDADTQEIVGTNYTLSYTSALGTVTESGGETTTYYYYYDSSTGDYVQTTYADYYDANDNEVYDTCFTVVSNTESVNKSLDISSGSYTGDIIEIEMNSSNGNGSLRVSSNSTIGDITGDFVNNYTGDTGGILVYTGATIDSIDSNFISGKAGRYTPGIYNLGTITSLEGTFIGGQQVTSRNGGAIFNDSAYIGTISADFIGNTLDYGYGGAIYNNNAEITTIKNSNFIQNEATYLYGGAIANQSGSSIDTITETLFSGNSVDSVVSSTSSSTYARGGAIYNGYSSTYGISTISTISYSDFYNNYAKSTYSYAYGGAIANLGSIDYITNDNFYGNYAESTSSYAYGGAIYNANTTITSISGTDFYNNYTEADTYSRGGAIFNADVIETISDSDFYNNYSESTSYYAYGGAIYNSYASISKITNCDFYNNEVYSTNSNYVGYGGAIYIYSLTGELTISESNFVSNSATGSGGAIYFSSYSSTYNSNLLFDNVSFIDNTAGIYGGAIYNGSKYSTIYITDAEFTDNDADYGGAIMNYGGTVSIKDAKFTGNTVTTDGGAIYNLSSVTITDATFTGNTAVADGGAIVNADTLTMTDVEFSSNSAVYGGAIVNYGTMTAYITESGSTDTEKYYWASDNSADYGGLLYAVGGSETTLYVYDNLGDVYIHNNKATEAGGFIYAESGSVNTFDIGSGSTVIVGDLTLSHSTDSDNFNTDSIYTESGSYLIKDGAGALVVHSNAEINGSMAVNAGTLVIEGDLSDSEDDDHWYEEVLSLEAEVLGSVTATLMVGSPVYVGDSLSVGTVLSDYSNIYSGDTNTVYLASDSVLVLHAHATGGTSGSNDENFDASNSTSAIMGDGNSSMYVGNDATLMVYGAIDTGTTEIRVLQGFDVMTNIDDSAIFDTSASTDTSTDTGTESGISTMSLSATTFSNSITTYETTDTGSTDAGSTDTGSTDGTDSSSSTASSSFSFGSVYVLDPRYEGYSQAEFSYGDSSDGSGGFVLTLAESEEGITNVGQMAAIGGVSSTLNLLVNSARDTTMARFSAFDKSYNVGSKAFKNDSFCKCSYDGETGQFYCDGNCECCGTKEDQNYGIWAIPMYIYSEARGLNAGAYSTGYDMYLGGGNIGFDYTVNEKYRFGIAFHGGAGETTSVGDFNETTNDFDFYSATLYAGYKKDNFLIYADVNVAYSNNELEQQSDGSVSGAEITTELDAYVFDASIRAEYIIEMDNFWITPHISFTYSYIDVDDYSVSQYGNDIYNVDSHGQSLFTIPVGVMFTTAIDLGNDWTLNPILDLGVIFTLGDLYADSTASFEDFSTYFLSVEAYNRYTFQGIVGFELKKDQHRIGLSYKIEASENITAHNFRLNYRYDF